MLIDTRTLLIVFTILYGVWHNVGAKPLSIDNITDDTDENLLLTICRLKFCTNVNHIVS